MTDIAGMKATYENARATLVSLVAARDAALTPGLTAGEIAALHLRHSPGITAAGKAAFRASCDHQIAIREAQIAATAR